MNIKVVGFDFFGTLVKANAEIDRCIGNICQKLRRHQISFSKEEFIQNYKIVSSNFRKVRLGTYKEVSNCVWLAATLLRLGYDLKDDSQPVIEAVESYFSPWALTVYKDTWSTILRLQSTYRMGLISNFTYTPFLKKSLFKLRLDKYFECVLVSEEVGWRKPHPHIFKKFLKFMNVEASETLFIGDDLEQDISGAKGVGMKTVWIVRDSKQKSKEFNVHPDFIIHSLEELNEVLP